MTRAGRLGDGLLWLTALLGVLVVGAVAAMWLTGTRPVVVQSGSMAPTYPMRSVVLTHRVDAGDIRPDDVVAVSLPGGRRVLHRVLDVARGSDGELVVRTKGDANHSADAEPVTLATDEEVWRAGAHLPGIGGIATSMRTPVAGIVLALIVLGPIALGRRPQPAMA